MRSVNATTVLCQTLPLQISSSTTLDLSGFFGTGQLENLKAVIAGVEQPAESDSAGTAQPRRPIFISAIFVSTYRLTSKQRHIMEEILEKPVLDRYNIVLQIFKRHARTREAKLQVELAELPYLR